MDVFMWAILGMVAFLLYVLLYDTEPKNLPPGPRGLPLFGYIPLLSEARHLSLTELSQKYGGLYSIKLGCKLFIMLNNWESMKAALVTQSDVFSGRPVVFALEKLFKRQDIVTLDGPLWKSKRRFALQHLRNFGFGKSSMETIIMDEIRNVTDLLDKQNNKKQEMSELFFVPLMNIVWGIIAGRRYDYEDEKMKSFSDILKNIFDMIKRANLMNAMPWLRFIPGDPAGFHALAKNHKKVVQFLMEEIDEHIATFQDGSLRDFIDVYLAEIYKQKTNYDKDSKNTWLNREHLVGTLFNFFNAGVETTAYTLVWSLMYMSLWPEIQRKVHQEIDRVIGRNRLPNYSDRFLMPYTEATLMETHRYASIVPLSIPHTPTTTTKLMGYTIPKGIMVIQNIWAVHHDKQYWKDPEVFCPERFFNDNGKLEKPEYLIPFSAGARKCLGEPLARMELFLFFTSLLQRYEFSCVDGEEPPSLDPVLSITLRPKPFHLIVKQR